MDFSSFKKKLFNNFKKIIEYVSKKNNFSQSEVDKICKAYDISKEAHEGQLRRSGEPYFNHCIKPINPNGISFLST